MNTFRMKSTGQVVTEAEYRNMYPNISFPAILAPTDADPVLAAPAPATTEHQSVHQAAPVQDALGNWVTGWAVTDWTEEQIATHEGAKAAGINVMILNQLVAIDAKSIRALREGDTARIAALEAEAVVLRGQFQ